jgi:hypothetical protein
MQIMFGHLRNWLGSWGRKLDFRPRFTVRYADFDIMKTILSSNHYKDGPLFRSNPNNWASPDRSLQLCRLWLSASKLSQPSRRVAEREPEGILDA